MLYCTCDIETTVTMDLFASSRHIQWSFTGSQSLIMISQKTNIKLWY